MYSTRPAQKVERCFSSMGRWQREPGLLGQCWGPVGWAHTTARLPRSTPNRSPQLWWRLVPSTRQNYVITNCKASFQAHIYLYLILLILVTDFITCRAVDSCVTQFIDICWQRKNGNALHIIPNNILICELIKRNKTKNPKQTRSKKSYQSGPKYLLSGFQESFVWIKPKRKINYCYPTYYGTWVKVWRISFLEVTEHQKSK